ncbi:MAG: DUF5107 domain-containing protein [Ruminococcaceae bacterium]|nr:DUF5107 domain-containing protein [Oscillospiraceae bacterium]
MLKFEKITLDSTNLGCGSTIPDIQKPSAVPFFICDESVGEGEGGTFGTGMVASTLPYTMQNMYDRNFAPRQYDAAILENEYLRAEFIPALGGRLWSLYDKKMKRDLVYKNDSLIFANLALRNAWFAGGVEWNIGVRGHTYFTCDKMFARKVVGKKGNDILRMYEFEEIRGLAYCIEATLRDEKLLIRISVKNTRNEPTYMYWWSNIAVEETKDTRIFVPANKTFVTSYREGGYRISKIDIPMRDGVDISYARNSKIAIDYFYDVPKESKKWVSGLEKDGKGLLQCSDPILQGRKTFLWGKEPGGHHWNRWLTNKNETADMLIGGEKRDGVRDYLEIQAGLCKTQFEHFLIDAKAELTWNEEYFGIDIGTNEGDYNELCRKIDSHVPERLDNDDMFDEAEVEPITYFGCGKGYLEERLAGEKFYEKCDFTPESVNEAEKYYLDLLCGKESIGDDKTAFIYNKKWQSVIEAKSDKTFFDCYILGVNAYANLDYDKAYQYLKKSCELKKEYYNLASLGLILLNVRELFDEGYECIRDAVKLNPEYIPLAIKFGEAAIKCEKYNDFISFYDNGKTELQSNGRMKMYVGQCLVGEGRIEEAKKYINKELVVEDVREGEYAISNIWVMLYRRELAKKTGISEDTITDAEVLKAYPIPYAIDFRMH